MQLVCRRSLGHLLPSPTSIPVRLIGISSVAAAQDQNLYDIGSVTCRDILMATGEDRDAMILVFHA